MHIGAIPDYAGDKAIRVLQYFVDGSLVALNHSIYHSSNYASKTDEQWETELEELKVKMEEVTSSIETKKDELSKL